MQQTKKQLLIISLVIVFSISVIQVYGINGTRIFNGQFQILNDKGEPVVRCLDSGMCVFNGITNNPDYSNIAHSNFVTSSTTYLSAGLGGYIDGKYQQPVYQSGIRTVAMLYLQNSIVNGGYEVALYRSVIGIPPVGTPPNTTDVKLIETPVFYQLGQASQYYTIPIQKTDVPTTNQTYYYYITVRAAVQGTVSMAATSSIDIELV